MPSTDWYSKQRRGIVGFVGFVWYLRQVSVPPVAKQVAPWAMFHNELGDGSRTLFYSGRKAGEGRQSRTEAG